MITIQATIVGYQGHPATLLSAYDPDTKVLAVMREEPYMQDRFKTSVVITNDKTINRDAYFDEEKLQDAIAAYFQLRDGLASDAISKRLVVSDRCARSDPSASIERDGMDSTGRKFRVSESITCAQIAALATCWYAESRADAVEKTLDMFDRLNEIQGYAKTVMGGGAITV